MMQLHHVKSEVAAPKDRHQSATTTDTPEGISRYDWRHAARVTERSDSLEAIDHALTATGLAAEIVVCAARVGRLS
jgi:hypothetical protein